MMNSINNFIIIDDQNDFRDALKKLSLDPDPLPEKPFPEKAPTDRFVGKKSGPLYGLHSYWSKKPYDAIKSSILKFTKENDIIIDPFCGSGSTIIASALTNRRSIGLDLSPAAFHISHFFLLPLFGKSSKRSIIDNWLLKIDKQTRDIRQFTWKRADWEIESLIYSEQYRCPKCYTWRLLSNFKKAHGKNCCDTPDCGEVINTRSRKIEYGPAKIVSAELRDLKARKKTTFEVQKNEELEKILENLENNIKIKLSTVSLPKGNIAQELLDFGGRLNSTQTKYISDLYTPRSLYILSLAREIALREQTYEDRASLLGILTAVSLNCTKMYRVRKSGGGGPATSFYIPPIRKEISVLNALKNKSKELIRISNEILFTRPITVLGTADISTLKMIPANTIDYIFTDPPYADTMPYGALNCVWESWIDADTAWRDREVLGENWVTGMKIAFTEMARILKPGRWLTLCYHDTSEGSWTQVQDIAAEAGLIPDESEHSIYISTTQKSWQQQVGGRVVKRDLLVHFQKPIEKALVINGNDAKYSFQEQAKAFILNLLSNKPGMSKDRIYDELISHSIRRGRIEPHDLDNLLLGTAERASHGADQWYIKNEKEEEIHSKEAASEEKAAEKIGNYLEKQLKKSPELEGIHFSNIFSFYVTGVKTKPRRSIQDWLLDFFFKTPDGTYRPPLNEDEEKEKARIRAYGTNRQIKRFITFVTEGMPIPPKDRPEDSTIAEWIRHCKRSGMFEQGKLLYEKGGINIENLADEVIVDAEEDYQVCVRMLERNKT